MKKLLLTLSLSLISTCALAIGSSGAIFYIYNYQTDIANYLPNFKSNLPNATDIYVKIADVIDNTDDPLKFHSVPCGTYGPVSYAACIKQSDPTINTVGMINGYDQPTTDDFFNNFNRQLQSYLETNKSKLKGVFLDSEFDTHIKTNTEAMIYGLFTQLIPNVNDEKNNNDQHLTFGYYLAPSVIVQLSDSTLSKLASMLNQNPSINNYIAIPVYDLNIPERQSTFNAAMQKINEHRIKFRYIFRVSPWTKTLRNDMQSPNLDSLVKDEHSLISSNAALTLGSNYLGIIAYSYNHAFNKLGTDEGPKSPSQYTELDGPAAIKALNNYMASP